MHSPLSQFLAVLTNRGLQKGVNLITIVILTHLMSVADFGVYGLFVTTTTLMTIFGAMGMQEALTYLIGQKPEKATTYLVNALIVLFLPCVIAIAASTYWLDRTTAITAWQWVLPVFFTHFGKSFLGVAQGDSLGHNHIRDFNISESFPVLILFLGAGLMVLFGWVDILYPVWMFSLSFFLASLIYLYKTFKGKDDLHISYDRKTSIDLIRYGMPFVFSSFLATANNSLGLYILQEKGLDEAVSHYFIAWQIFNSLLNIANALGLVLFSHTARTKDTVAALQNSARYTSIILWAMMILGGVAALFSPWIVPIVFGSQYAAAVPVIQLIFCGIGFVSISRIMYRTLSGVGLSYICAVLFIPATLINGVASWFLIDAIGQEGAIVALILSQITTVASYLILIKLRFSIPVLPFIIPSRSELKIAYGSVCSYAAKLTFRRR